MTRPHATLQLHTARLTLRSACAADGAALADYYLRNREHLGRYSPRLPDEMVTADGAAERLAEREREMAQGRALPWLLFERDAPARVVGAITFDQIHRGAFQSCMLGYGIDAAHEGQGLMTEALRAALDHAFDALRLHRVQANHLPENRRSARVLQRLGFVREGLAPRYLYIDGAWRDHVLNSLINPRYDDRWLEEQ